MKDTEETNLEDLVEEYKRKQKEQNNEIVYSNPEGEVETGRIAPLRLGEALDKHEEIQRSNDRAELTIESHRSRLKKFGMWLLIQGVEETTDIQPQHFEDYRIQRAKNVKKVTVKTHMDTIRVWIRNMETYRAVPEGLSEFVRSPELTGSEGQRSDHLPVERGDRILENVRKYMWGSMEHVVYELWWAAAIRLGGVHSLDVDDFNPKKGYVQLKHRPESGTTLKNREKGERVVSLHPTVIDAIEDYLDNPERPDTTDEYGREPLLASTKGGRYSKSHLRNVCYYLTLPCVTENGCPHDRDPKTCQWASNKCHSSRCKSSKAPHALRSGALTRQLKRGVPPHVLSERANVGVDTLEDHYNELTEEEKMEVRRKWFDEEYMSGQDAEDAVFGD
ncbi:tyrosine-type recombinase/integrase [Haloferax denitrificans]|uniref:tyrosine-type recombinase/integrase n=1 Tax=Haloferax denitrificans TaxID=35745 RepID=UPI003C6FD5B4